MEQNRYDTLFSVAELAKLCGVKPTTVRRWRTDGLGGAKLIPYDADETAPDSDRSGGFLLFHVDTIRNFVQKNPRILTPDLRRALKGADPARTYGQSPSFDAVNEESAPYNTQDRTQYYYSLLCSREAELRKELAYICQEKEKIEAERR